MEGYDLLDIKSESQILSVEEKARFDFILNDLRSFWILEETKAKQTSRERFIVEGYRNTAYFSCSSKSEKKEKINSSSRWA
jgi:hypothetical protein